MHCISRFRLHCSPTYRLSLSLCSCVRQTRKIRSRIHHVQKRGLQIEFFEMPISMCLIFSSFWCLQITVTFQIEPNLNVKSFERVFSLKFSIICAEKLCQNVEVLWSLTINTNKVGWILSGSFLAVLGFRTFISNCGCFSRTLNKCFAIRSTLN